MEARHVVTAFLLREGKILLLRRSDDVSTYGGRWSGVSGYVEEEPPRQALREIAEETGYRGDEIEHLATGEPVVFRDEDLQVEWTVHPFLYRLESLRPPDLDEENREVRWVEPGELEALDTVPHLAEALERIWPPPEKAPSR